MLATLKRLRALLFDRGSKTARRRQRTDPLLSGPPQADARSHDTRGPADPNARFLSADGGPPGMGGDASGGSGSAQIRPVPEQGRCGSCRAAS
jgi:hypothetical protein